MKIKLSILVLAILAAFAMGNLLGTRTVEINYTTPYPQPQRNITYPSLRNVSAASIRVPAVDEDGKGVLTYIDVQVAPGTGNVLTDIERILFWVDTQDSIRTARWVAGNVTGVELEDYDFVYSITADATVIEGPSAGAAIAIATIAALENRSISEDVMITGTVNEDGTIGSVGSVYEKALTAKDSGASTFLVPRGSISMRVGYEREKVCETIHGIEYCRIEYVAKEVDVGEDMGITIKEVKNIQEAMGYFL